MRIFKIRTYAKRIKINFLKKYPGKLKIPMLEVSYIKNFEDYNHYLAEHCKNFDEIEVIEQQLISSSSDKFTVNGICYVCKKQSQFIMDSISSWKTNDVLILNWRERMICSHCKFNNRMRAIVQVFQQELKPTHGSKIYLTEQMTQLYAWFYANYPGVVGSEYLGNSIESGENDKNGIRNENFTKLSFRDDEFDYILSFDVLEHIPNYNNALRECFRCLKPSGILFFSIPFSLHAENNLVRAYIDKNGKINHIYPPEYHGNPLSSEGSLCFHYFGWELLDQLRELGFHNVKALLYWSKELGYLGGKQVLFQAIK